MNNALFIFTQPNLPVEIFDPQRPYGGCRICGDVYQPSRHLNYPRSQALVDRWRAKHDEKHTRKEHASLTLSGRWCTPEAALRLVSYGIIPIGDLTFSDEHAHAGRIAPIVPDAPLSNSAMEA